MIKKHVYNTERYAFIALIEELFEGNDLQQLGAIDPDQYGFFSAPGSDSDTVFHNRFYDRMRAGWPEMIDTYKRFLREVIAPIMDIEDRLIYQKWPTFRIHLPNNVAVGGWHKDEDYNHPKGEVNFIVAITEMFESNTTISESTPGKMDFRQLEMKPGEFTQFNGNQCIHGNLPNRTGVTRVSFDFRVLPTEQYNPEHDRRSLSKARKFVIGDYYDEIIL